MKILIVDDEPLIRRSLSRVLKSRGHEISEAGDGTDGLQLWKKQDPDLVFLDVLMPGLTGPQVLEAIGQPRRAKVVLMSAFAGDQQAGAAQKSGADVFFSKPFEDIFQIVEQAEGLCR